MNDRNMDFSPLIIGTMRLGRWGAGLKTQQLERFVNACVEMDLRTFDHADIYGDYTTESDFGQLLKNNSSLRAELQLITKCGVKLLHANRPDHTIKSYDTSREHILMSVENSLRNLQTDYLDVLLIHRPDYLLNPQEVAECFTELRDSGKVRAFGVSNFTPDQFDMLNTCFPLITNQVEISLLTLNPFTDGTLSQCMLSNIRPMAWSPVGGGALFKPSSDPAVQPHQNGGW